MDRQQTSQDETDGVPDLYIYETHISLWPSYHHDFLVTLALQSGQVMHVAINFGGAI
jgi:hypothetical protein